MFAAASSLRARTAPDAPARAIVSCAGALALGALPAFLVGALSRPIGDELGFGPAGAGVALAAFFVASGCAAVPVGWVTDRIGPPAAMRTGAVLSGAATLLIGVGASALSHIGSALALAGVAIAFVDTGASAWFARVVPLERHGLAFGIKESSVPAASLLTGASLPLLAAHLGWRPVFVIAACLTPVVWLVVPRSSSLDAPIAEQGSVARAGWGPLVVFALGIALGTGAATAASTFMVPALEVRGWTSSAAGVMLAAASVGSIVFRVVAGRMSDRVPASIWSLIAASMTAGGAGAAALWLDPNDVVVIAGALVVLGLGWGWTGLAFHAVLQATADRPALGAGLVLGGLSLGGAAGPAAFGAVSAGISYGTAWAGVAAIMVLAAVCTEVSRVLLRDDG